MKLWTGPLSRAMLNGRCVKRAKQKSRSIGEITQQAEVLEKRALLTVTTSFDAVTGALEVSSDGADAITIDSNFSDEVTINGVVLEDDGSAVDATDVVSIVVNGGTGNNNIDLSGVSVANGYDNVTSVSINGDDGNDTIVGSDFADSISAGAGTDSVSGGQGNDTISGGASGAGVDTLNGGFDDDTFFWDADIGDGAWNVTGGDGNDTLQVNGDSTDADSARLKKTGDQFEDTFLIEDLDTNVDFITGVEIEALQFDGRGGDDTFELEAQNFTTQITDITVRGGTGNDIIDTTDYSSNGDITLVVDGEAGDDTMLAAAGEDSGDLFGDTFNLSVQDGAATLLVNDDQHFSSQDATALIRILGSASDDALTVDFSNGNPIPQGGLEFVGGGDLFQGDTLTLSGGTASLVAHQFDNDSDGKVLVFTGGSLAEISYTGLDTDNDQTIADSIAATNRSFNYSDADDSIVINDNAGVDDGTSVIETDGTGIGVEFSNPTGSLTVNAGDGDDTIAIDGIDGLLAANITLNGNGDDDDISGFLLIDEDVTINGGAGEDFLEGGQGDDVINGGTGDDFINGNFGNDNITGSSGNDTIFGAIGDDTIQGNAGDDNLDGQGGRDKLFGGEGNDFVRGGSDNDFLHGYTGNDTLNGEDGNDTLTGGDGNDAIDGANGNDNIAGDDGDDVLSGSNGTDFINGGFGNDIINGGNNNDNLLGGAGNDTINGGAGNDFVLGHGGNDLIRGETNNDFLRGGAGNDTLLGGGGNDIIAGEDGNDEIDGGDGNDTANGGAGDDTMLGGDGNDGLSGTTGNDFLNGGFGNDTLIGGENNDSLFGGSGNDIALGGDGDDVVNGQGGSDTVAGNAGNDSIGDSAGEIDEGFTFFAGWVDSI